jgi:hypothetical protein
MADVLQVQHGAAPWRPAQDAEAVTEFEYYDVPLSGVVRQHNVDYLFLCAEGATESVSLWLYLHVTDSERDLLAGAETPEEFDGMVDAMELDRPAVLAVAGEGRGILAYRVIPAADEGSVKQALRELAEELERLAGETKLLVAAT